MTTYILIHPDNQREEVTQFFLAMSLYEAGFDDSEVTETMVEIQSQPRQAFSIGHGFRIVKPGSPPAANTPDSR